MVPFLLFLPIIFTQHHFTKLSFQQIVHSVLHLNCNLVLLIIDFQYEYAIPFRSNPRELPSNIDHETIYSQRLTPIEFRDSTRRFNSKKKKRKKKNVTRAKKTRGCNDYPHQECIPVYVYIQNAPYDGIRCPFVSIRCWTKRNDGGFTLLRATQR